MRPDDSELEALTEFLRGWRVEVIQLGPRSDRTLTSSVSCRSHRVLRLHADSAFVLRGTVHKHQSCLLLSASRQAAIRFLGQPLGANELMFAGAGASLDLFVPSGAVLHILVAETREGISRRALRICQDTTADEVALLTRYIKHPDQHHGEINGTLAKHLRHAVTESSSTRLDGNGNALRVSAVVSACRLIEKRFPEPPTLSELSRHCGVAERTLEYGFKQVYDTTPLTFARNQRLTRSRMALLRAAARTSISETARACGFTHMGQYSRDYRRLFGETPSMTRARVVILVLVSGTLDLLDRFSCWG